MPGIFCWPGHIPAGQIIREPCAAMDVFPTLLTLAGGDPAGYKLDGASLLPVLTEGARSPHRELFWEMEQQTAIRQGRVQAGPAGPACGDRAAPGPGLSLRSDEDPGETRNLASAMPELTEELTARALQWRSELEAYWKEHFPAAARSLT